jgi:CO/xanthine dehydrogenase Mo-binding subunit
MKPSDATHHALSRRDFLAASGALIVGFSLASSSLRAQKPAAGPKLPGSLDANPMLDSWIRIDADGSITVFSGKAELGQGVKTALIQIAAEQLYVAPQRIRLITADTRQTPDEGYTAGSNSMKDSGTAIMNAAAQVREILIAKASERLGVAADRLKRRRAPSSTTDGGSDSGELVGDNVTRARRRTIEAQGSGDLFGRRQRMPRVDIRPR